MENTVRQAPEGEVLSEEKLHQWMAQLDQYSIDESTSEIEGVKVTVSEDFDLHSDKVVQYMTLANGVQLKREGSKEISYERWVDTWWHSWELES